MRRQPIHTRPSGARPLQRPTRSPGGAPELARRPLTRSGRPQLLPCIGSTFLLPCCHAVVSASQSSAVAAGATPSQWRPRGLSARSHARQQGRPLRCAQGAARPTIPAGELPLPGDCSGLHVPALTSASTPGGAPAEAQRSRPSGHVLWHRDLLRAMLRSAVAKLQQLRPGLRSDERRRPQTTANSRQTNSQRTAGTASTTTNPAMQQVDVWDASGWLRQAVPSRQRGRGTPHRARLPHSPQMRVPPELRSTMPEQLCHPGDVTKVTASHSARRK